MHISLHRGKSFEEGLLNPAGINDPSQSGSTVPTFNSCTKCLVTPGIVHDQLPPSFLDMDACTTSQLNVVLIRKLLCAWFIFDILLISVFTTRHWQTSGQLVQELNVGTVFVSLKLLYNPIFLFVSGCVYIVVVKVKMHPAMT